MQLHKYSFSLPSNQNTALEMECMLRGPRLKYVSALYITLLSNLDPSLKNIHRAEHCNDQLVEI